MVQCTIGQAVLEIVAQALNMLSCFFSPVQFETINDVFLLLYGQNLSSQNDFLWLWSSRVPPCLLTGISQMRYICLFYCYWHPETSPLKQVGSKHNLFSLKKVFLLLKGQLRPLHDLFVTPWHCWCKKGMGNMKLSSVQAKLSPGVHGGQYCPFCPAGRTALKVCGWGLYTSPLETEPGIFCLQNNVQLRDCP